MILVRLVEGGVQPHIYHLNVLHSNFLNKAPKGTESGVGFLEWMKFGTSGTKKCPFL